MKVACFVATGRASGHGRCSPAGVKRFFDEAGAMKGTTEWRE